MKPNANSKLSVTISFILSLLLGTGTPVIGATVQKNNPSIRKKTVIQQHTKRQQNGKHHDWTQKRPFIPETQPSQETINHSETVSSGTSTKAPSVPPVLDIPSPEHKKYETDIQRALGGSFADNKKTPASGNGYAIGNSRIEMSYGKENDRSGEQRDMIGKDNGKNKSSLNPRLIESNSDRDVWHLGFGYDKGKHHFNTSVDYLQMQNEKDGASTNNDDPADMKTITFGYSHDVSENTSLYGAFSHTEYDQDKLPSSSKNTDDSINQFSVGIKHRF